MTSSAAKTVAELSSTLPPIGPAARLGTAIVLGGSVAGLLAARVLADHAETVIVVERDPAAAETGPRHGVPQGSQVHVLVAAGSFGDTVGRYAGQGKRSPPPPTPSAWAAAGFRSGSMSRCTDRP